MMDDLIGPNVGIPERVCYLPCIEIFASSRSPRIAELLSVATTGKNEPPRGIMGKIQAFLEQCSQAHEDLGVYCSQQGRLIPYMGDMYDSCSIQDDSVVWTLNDYAGRLSSGKKGEEWDELEKSIIANVADDVVVNIRRHRVEVTVSKVFRR